MIRFVILIVFISIALTQCLPQNDKVSSLKFAQSIKIHSANGNSFGCVDNFNNTCEGTKTNDLKKLEYFFAEKSIGK